MTPEEIVIIEDGILIQHQILKLIENQKAIVRVSWSRYGILDIGPTSEHVITIYKNGVVVPDFPISLTGNQAYLANYSVMVNDWDPTALYQVDIAVNTDVIRSKIIYPSLGAQTNPLPDIFQPGQFTAFLRNTERGIIIELGTSCGACKKFVRNVTIHKGVGTASTPIPAFTSSVPFSYTLDSDYTNYSYLVKDNAKKDSFTSPEFDEIYDNRTEILFYYFGTQIHYLEDIDPVSIASYGSDKIVSVVDFSALNPANHNDTGVLYLTVSENKYYKFRNVFKNIPNQFNQLYPELRSLWASPDGFNNALTTFDIYLDGTQTMPGELLFISAALKDNRNNFTSYNTLNAATTPPINSLLPAGVTFMTETFKHIDSNVVEGEVYKYKITVETLEGKVVTVYQGAVERQLPTRGFLPSGVTKDNLMIPVTPDNTLYEDDFQSGPANRHLKVHISDDRGDYRLYLVLKEKDESFKCQN